MHGMKLLDNGWSILLFKDGLGDINALAFPAGMSADEALQTWREHEENESVSIEESIYDGPNRRCGGGRTINEALNACEEKIIFRRLPLKDKE